MRNQITRRDLDIALASSPWDLGNDVLHGLCKKHPKHDNQGAIIAKVWLIGRSYAAAIERRRNAKESESSDDFYETTVAGGMMKSEVDEWLSSLPGQMSDPWGELARVVWVHKKLMDLFAEMTRLEKRALASKYLHFHRPDLFFIYDSRAKGAVAKVTPPIAEIRRIEAGEADPEYLAMVRRCQWVRDDVETRFGKALTPRQVDKMLLRIANEKKGSHPRIQ